jgi:3-phosphoshikimate 1-carboxyvinyltransferase
MTQPTIRRLRPASRLEGSIRVPSDKSIAHRALICAALAIGRSRITLREPGADLMSTISALQSLGVSISAQKSGDLALVSVDGLGDASSLGALSSGVGDCGNSGTSMRLMAGAVASGSGVATLMGDESLSRRPMQRVADPLRAMGAEIELNEGHAPLVVHGRRPLRAMEHTLTVASAQVLGAISFAALAADGTTIVHVPGRVRDHTERMLSALGADIQQTTNQTGTTVAIRGPSGLQRFDMVVPGDFSSASAWIVAGALHADANIRLTNVGLNPTRTALLEVMRRMGADIEVLPGRADGGEPDGDIVVRGGQRLHAISLGADDVAPLIDELPLLAVAMAAADGISEVRGAHELRIKESDRIAAIGAALTAVGVEFEELEDGWRIRADRPRDAHVVTHGDHRIAMAMAVAAWIGVATSVELDDPQCVAVSYPSFWSDARSIGAFG